MIKHGAYARPGALPPWRHNELVARRKKYRALARQFRAVGRSGTRVARSMRQLGDSADRAAASLQNLIRQLRR